jgi:hypothetical protein
MEEDEDYHIRKHENLPIFKKAEEIYEVVDQIGQLIPEDDEHLQYI